MRPAGDVRRARHPQHPDLLAVRRRGRSCRKQESRPCPHGDSRIVDNFAMIDNLARLPGIVPGACLKITDVEAVVLRQPAVNEGIADGSQDDLVILVHTDEGITGIGEVDSAPEAVAALVQRARLARDREQPARAADRRGPARRRAALAEDVSRRHLRRPARDRDPCDQRHRHRALGHRGQGARQAGVRAARHAAARPGSCVRLAADARHDRGGHRGRVGAARAGLHRGQARLGAARAGPRPRRPPRRRGPRGRRRRRRDPDRRRPRLRRRRGRRRSASRAGSRSSASSGSRSRSSRTSTRPTPSSRMRSTSRSPPASRTRPAGASAS